MSNNEPRDSSHYRNNFANPAGRISELENTLEFAKQEIEAFRDKWISEKRKSERRHALLGEVFSAFPPIKSKEECDLLARVSREIGGGA